MRLTDDQRWRPELLCALTAASRRRIIHARRGKCHVVLCRRRLMRVKIHLALEASLVAEATAKYLLAKLPFLALLGKRVPRRDMRPTQRGGWAACHNRLPAILHHDRCSVAILGEKRREHL